MSSNPETQKPESPQVKEIRVDLVKYSALKALSDSEGGKIIINALKTDIADDVQSIISLFRGNDLEIRCAIAKLKADLDLYTILIHSEENVKMGEEVLSKLLEKENN